LGRFLVLANRVMGEEIALPRMFFSELSRWGGLNSLRGFNEQSIFANSFHLAMTELRFMTGTAGFIAPFFSVARYVNKTAVGGPAFGMPYSTGIAASVKTAVGILQICWALGSDQGVPPKLNNSKFHMGIGSTF
jgi:outer membrane protein assembly factor BamA